MSGDLELSRELTAIVTSTAGVIEVYPPGPLGKVVAVDLVKAVVPATLDDAPAADAKVAVSRLEGGRLVITAMIGADSSRPVPDTLRAVGDALKAFALDSGSAAEITVRVSYID